MSEKLLQVSAISKELRICDATTFQLNWQKWLQTAMESSQSIGGNSVKLCHMSIRLLREILTESVSYAAIKREIALNHISAVIDLLLTLNAHNIEVLECMSVCILHYSASLSRFWTKLVAYLWQGFDSSDDNLVLQAAATCFAQLPNIGTTTTTKGLLDQSASSSTDQRQKQASVWQQQFASLIVCCNEYLKELISLLACEHHQSAVLLSESDVGISLAEARAFLGLPKQKVSNAMSLSRSIFVLLQIMEAMLQTEFSGGVVTVNAVAVLKVVISVCQTYGAVLKSKTNRHDKIPIVASICTSLGLLRSLANNTHTKTFVLLFHCKITNDLLLPLMRQIGTALSVDQDRETFEACGRIRVCVYEALKLLAVRFGVAWTDFSSKSDFFVQEALNDLTFSAPTKNEASLVSQPTEKSSAASSSHSKRKKRRLLNEFASGEDHFVVKLLDESWRVDVRCAAGDFLASVVSALCGTLPLRFYQNVQTHVAKLCLEMQQQPISLLSGSLRSAASRLSLYKLLNALIVSPSPFYPPIIHAAVKIFAKGRQDANPAVAEFCTFAAAVCSAFARPRVACLDPPFASAASEQLNVSGNELADASATQQTGFGGASSQVAMLRNPSPVAPSLRIKPCGDPSGFAIIDGGGATIGKVGEISSTIVVEQAFKESSEFSPCKNVVSSNSIVAVECDSDVEVLSESEDDDGIDWSLVGEKIKSVVSGSQQRPDGAGVQAHGPAVKMTKSITRNVHQVTPSDEDSSNTSGDGIRVEYEEIVRPSALPRAPKDECSHSLEKETEADDEITELPFVHAERNRSSGSPPEIIVVEANGEMRSGGQGIRAKRRSDRGKHSLSATEPQSEGASKSVVVPKSSKGATDDDVVCLEEMLNDFVDS